MAEPDGPGTGDSAADTPFAGDDQEGPVDADIVLPRYSAIIFVHGCFWHRHAGCPYATAPKTRAAFWTEKLNSNRKRDRRQIRMLLRRHWRVLVVWECALRKADEQSDVVASVEAWIRTGSEFAEIPARTIPLRTLGITRIQTGLSNSV